MNKTVYYQKIGKLFGFIFAIGLTFSCLTAKAQTPAISLDMRDATVGEVMKQIEKQTRYVFFYNDVDVNRKIDIDVQDKPIAEVLGEIFKDREESWKIDGTQIILSRKSALQSAPVTVKGIVSDATGNPIIGAAVLIKGTTTGTSTGIDGSYTLQIPPPSASAVLVVNYLGYEPAEVAVGSRTDIDITLRESALAVDAVVVTALGIKRSEKALSYNVQQVASEAITANKDANFINSLNGKVAGVNINASSSGVGGATRVIMRGVKSIMQTSNALYVIDGVPMITSSKDSGSDFSEFSSQGSTDPIADINPEDIESISVLTGAAAAALYGSDAANGAIVVTTKKGKVGTLSVTVTSSVEVMSPFVLPRFQNRYGTGDLNSAAGSELRSWGRRLNSANNPNYNPRDDYFETGINNSESISLSAGTEKNQTYFSAAEIHSRGIVPNNDYQRYNFKFRNTTSFLKDKMTLDVSADYVLQKDRNMVNQGTYSNPIVGAYIFPRSNNWEDIKMFERYNPVRNLYAQYWPMDDAGMTVQNPYWVNYRNPRENRKDRYMLGASLSYDVLDWLNVSGRIRYDNSQTDYTEKFYATTNTQLTERSNRGLFGITTTKDRQVYGDLLVNINKHFGDDWTLQVNAGASFSDMKNDALKVRGPIADESMTDENPGLTNVFNVQNLSNSFRTTRKQEGWREQTQSLFASAEIGYKGAYYLTLTGRNDWPSALAGPKSTKSSFFYPSVGASVVLSQIIPRMPENLSYIKLRASYASVGVAFERFIANPRYEWDMAGLTWKKQTTYPAYMLNPERTSSYEIGLTMRFLKHFNLDFSFYDSYTKHQTFDPQISTGSGASGMYIQSGNVRNMGIELSLGYRNTWNKFTWDTGYTLSTNKNEILELADDVYNYVSGERISIDLLDMKGLGQAHFLLKKGGTMGDLYSMIDLKHDSNGAIYVNEEGNIPTEMIQDRQKYVKMGSVLPDANMAWRNDFRWGNFNFGFLLTARIGGIVYSRTQAVLDYYGVSEASALSRDAGGVRINGGDLIDANVWYTAIGGGTSVPHYYVYSATNVRLQEASIGYTIPRRKLGDVCEITLSLVGRNLWMIYNKAPFDPESIATTGNFYQGVDYFMMPSLRNIGFNIRLKF